MIFLRSALALLALTAPLHAWEFQPLPICTLTDAASQTRLTYDGQTYTLNLTKPEGWPPGPTFTIRFEGSQGLTISTTRHQITGNTLSVSDSGFGNVLNGLQFNDTAVAITGGIETRIDLMGAKDPTAAFRACKPGPGA